MLNFQYTNIKGKIVVTAQLFAGYPETVKFRRSVKLFESLGAIGVLIKSITSFSISSPHTGSGAGSSILFIYFYVILGFFQTTIDRFT